MFIHIDSEHTIHKPKAIDKDVKMWLCDYCDEWDIFNYENWETSFNLN